MAGHGHPADVMARRCLHGHDIADLQREGLRIGEESGACVLEEHFDRGGRIGMRQVGEPVSGKKFATGLTPRASEATSGFRTAHASLGRYAVSSFFHMIQSL